jgi:hypothetical protein
MPLDRTSLRLDAAARCCLEGARFNLSGHKGKLLRHFEGMLHFLLRPYQRPCEATSEWSALLYRVDPLVETPSTPWLRIGIRAFDTRNRLVRLVSSTPLAGASMAGMFCGHGAFRPRDTIPPWRGHGCFARLDQCAA